MSEPARIYQFERPRPVFRGPMDRAGARARLTEDFRRGDLERRVDIARQLHALAAEVMNGAHGELVLTMAGRLLQLRAKGIQ